MCSHCQLAMPSGPKRVCHACAVALRAEARRGLAQIERYLNERDLLERWFTRSEDGPGAEPEPPPLTS